MEAQPADSPATRPEWEAYPKWLATKSEIVSTQMRTESVISRIKDTLEGSEFWTNLCASLDTYNDEYTSQKRYKLFVTLQPPLVLGKPYLSTLDKSFRKNIMLNKNWPDPPDGGWITSENWYYRLNDIVRTSFIVKYLDGVDFFVERVRALAEESGHAFSVDYEAREEGYYAAHCYVKFKADIPAVNWDAVTIEASFEIQVTTQLQEVIRNLTHKYYEDRRSRESLDVKWQWNYKCPEFVPNYLGHILHYIEGMIMEVRDRDGAEVK